MSSTDFVFICSDSSVFTENVIPIESNETNANGMNNLDSFGTSSSQPQQSPINLQSNEINEENDVLEKALQFDEDSSLHSSPTPSQPSSQSQHQNIIQHEGHFSAYEFMTESVPISSTQSNRSPQQSFKKTMIYDQTSTLKPPIILSNPITSKRTSRNKKFRTPKDMYLQYCNSGRKECKMMRNRKKLLAHLRTYHGINLDQPNSLQSIPLTLDAETLSSQQQSSEEELALQCKKESSLQSSSQHLVRECRIDDAVEKVDAEIKSIESSMKGWTWNEVEKCWEMMNNDQIDGDEGNDEVGQLNELDNLPNIESAEVERNLRPYNQQQTLKHQQINLDQFNPNSTQSTSSNQTRSNPLPSQTVSSSLDQFSGNLVQSSRECRIDGQEEKVDDEMKSIESSMKRWTWNEVEKCWELMKNGQIADDEGNDEVGEECDDDESEVDKEIDEDDQHGGDQLKGLEHESNIEVAVAPANHKPSNMNTSLTPPQCRASVELLNDQNIEHTNQTLLTNLIQSASTSSYRNNTLPFQLKKSLDEKGLNEHSVYSSLPVTLDKPNSPTHLSTSLSDFTVFQSNALPSESVSLNFDCDYPVSVGEIEVINVNQQLQSVFIDNNGLNGSNINENQQPQLCQKTIVHKATGLSSDEDSDDHILGKFDLEGTNLDETNSAQGKQNGQLLAPDKSTVKHVCKKCGKEFTKRFNLVRHFQVHSGMKPFSCIWKNCGKTFAERSTLNRHIRTHSGAKPFICSWKDCHKAFARRNCLNSHIQTHSGENPFICPWENCHKSFARKDTMQVHYMAHNVELPADLTGHTLSHTKERLISCPWKDCGKTFVSKKGLKLHLKSHDGKSRTSKKYLCEYCGKTFNVSTNLVAHIRTHTGEKPFKCPWKDCDKTFAQKSNLKTHFIRHSLRSIKGETIQNGIFNLASTIQQQQQQQ